MNTGVIGGFEEAIEKGQGALTKAAKQTVKDFTNTAKGQITGSTTSQAQSDQGTNEQANSAQQQMSDDQAKQFLKDLYGPTKKTEPEKPKSHPITQALGVSEAEKNVDHPVTEALGIPQVDPNAGKTPEELAKLQKLRSQLHQDYYQNLVNRPKPKEEPVAEKLEKEEQMEALAEQKKNEDLPGPLQNVKTGTAETNIGVAG